MNHWKMADIWNTLMTETLGYPKYAAGAYLSVGFAVISMFGMFLFLSYHLQLVLGYSPVKPEWRSCRWLPRRRSAGCRSRCPAHPPRRTAPAHGRRGTCSPGRALRC